MPRPKKNRNDLSEGWRELHRSWKKPLHLKTNAARRFVKKVLAQHDRPVVCWSGGKDSGVVLHLVRQFMPDVPVVYVDSGVEFSETKSFIRQLAQQWDLNLVVAKPEKGVDFWSIGESYGWPICGKATASNVERALRTGNVRDQLSSLERTLVQAGIRISCKCSEYLQERPSKRAEEKLGADVKFVGIRAAESRSRVRLWIDHGQYFFVKRYYGRGRGIWKANPIGEWTDEDIWKYHGKYNIPHCPLYDMGYTRNGCWPCAMGARHGQLARLRKLHPRRFRRLLTKTPMGMELMKIKLLLADGQFREAYSDCGVAECLKHSPTAFDTL